MSITFPLRIKRIARRGRPSYFSGESRGLGSRLPFRSCFCCRLIEMNLLVHVIDPIDPDEVLPAARFRIVLAQYDAIGSLQAVDSTNVLLSKPTTSMPFRMSKIFEHVAPPLITN